MVKYCEYCRELHDENQLCPKYEEMYKQHPEWFNEMVQTMATASLNSPIIQRYGAAVKEHLVAYDGKDYENGFFTDRSLKTISQSKINPNDYNRNIRQQAGFAAEIKSTARSNAYRKINGDDSQRTIRTDDMRVQSDYKGGSIGGTNDQHYDIAEVDQNGTYIFGSGRQLKFVGADAEKCTETLLNHEYDKYRDHNVQLEIPSNYYDDVLTLLNKKAIEKQSQIIAAEQKGNTELALKYKEQLDRIEKTRNNLKKGNVTDIEAIEARLHPKLSTFKDIAKNAHDAGLKGAKTGAIIGSVFSIYRNVVLLKNGDIEAKVALKNITFDTASSAASGYFVTAGGTALKGAMQHSSSATMQALSTTAFPGTVVAAAYGITKSSIINYARYKNGEISKAEAQKFFGKDAIKGTLISCSLAMIAFPPGIVGVAASMGVAIYLDAVCTNMLDEIFGDGFYEQLLHACGHLVATAQNSVELLEQLKENAQITEFSNRASLKILSQMDSEAKNVSAKLSRLANMKGL